MEYFVISSRNTFFNASLHRENLNSNERSRPRSCFTASIALTIPPSLSLLSAYTATIIINRYDPFSNLTPHPPASSTHNVIFSLFTQPRAPPPPPPGGGWPASCPRRRGAGR